MQWTLLGHISRMAMTMGLHRDPSEFSQKISPYWAEQRRRIWFTILELDLQMSLQCSLPGSVRSDDYNCRPPLNINDDELYPDLQDLPTHRPMDVHTDTRIQAFASRTLALRSKVVDIINRIDSVTDYRQV